MGVEATERREETTAATDTKTTAKSAPPPAPNRIALAWATLRTGLRELRWREVLLFGIGSGLMMPFLFAQTEFLSFFAGIIPVGAGLLLGRRAKKHYTLHGFVAGLLGAIVSLIALWVLLFLTPLGAAMQDRISQQNPAVEAPTPEETWIQLSGFIAFSLLTFCTFGASMAGRSEERNRAMRQEVESRGGRLERAGAVRTADDIRGLSLPQFGWYVNNLFKKKGFQFKDYRFIDKDKHLDLWLEHEGEPWHLRLTVVDKVGPGTIESLNQELKREGGRKGVVLTSTEFLPSAVKSAKGRPIVLIDGRTLFEIAEG
jgi:hypothetical protein